MIEYILKGHSKVEVVEPEKATAPKLEEMMQEVLAQINFWLHMQTCPQNSTSENVVRKTKTMAKNKIAHVAP